MSACRVVHRAVVALLLALAWTGPAIGPAIGRAETRHAAPADSEREVVVLNRARLGVNELYLSPSAAEEWGDDRLGARTLEPGHALRVRLGRVPDCLLDMQAVYEDGSREERHRVNICREREVVLDGSGAVAPADEAGPHGVVVVNEAGRPIQQVLISPAQSGEWGDDLLDHASLSVGERATVAYRGGCLADLRVVFDNRAAEERRDLDLCGLRGVRIRPGWTTADVLAPLPEPTPSAVLVAVEVTVANQSGHAARQLFVAPAGAADRGPDLLGAGELADGARLTLQLRRPSDTCRFDAHVVYGGKAPDQDFRGLDLCRDQTITLLPRA